MGSLGVEITRNYYSGQVMQGVFTKPRRANREKR